MNTADLAAAVVERSEELDRWFDGRAASLRLPPYCSVDLRDAGFKVAPVDCNLFPAGYNNLAEHYFSAATQAWKEQLEALASTGATVCVIPESHTRNTYYLQNVTNIVKLLSDAGFEPLIGTVDPIFVNEVTQLEAADGTPLTIHKAVRDAGTLLIDGKRPEVVLLNNDLSAGLPEELVGLEQHVVPPAELGWHSRRKSDHFGHYATLAAEWADAAEVDPWLVTPDTRFVEGVDFHEPDTFDELAATVDEMVEVIQHKYAENGVDEQPRCFIKDDSGTYGMGILVASSGDDVRGLNRKQRNKMDRGKADAIISRVLVQEAVPTVSEVNGATAEPVLYAVGDRAIGGFMRYNAKRGVDENLNARGAQFTDLCAGGEDDCFDTDPTFLLYRAVTRISILAAALEIEGAVTTRTQ